MEPRRMSISRSWSKEHQFPALVAILVLFGYCSAVVDADLPKFTRIFVIGDSYQDIGNRDPSNNTRTVIGNVNQPWKTPYGRTVGKPQGRFADADKCLADYLADSLNLKPRPYRVLNDNSHPSSVSNGVNFAVGGAGVFPNEGVTKTGDQINQLRTVLASNVGGPYTTIKLLKSVVFYGLAGNDYGANLRRNGNLPLPALITQSLAFSASVIAQATKDVQALYDMGFRSFVIGKLPPLGCIPAIAYNPATETFACNEFFNVISTTHNTNLTSALTTSLPRDAKVIYLNNQAAFGTVTNNVTNPGRLVPCCSGLKTGTLCGDVDASNNPVYDLCDPSVQGSFFFWDEFHPTSAGWKKIFNLYLDDSFFSFPGGFPLYPYTDGKSLKKFLGV